MNECEPGPNPLEMFNQSFHKYFSEPRNDHVLSARIRLESKHAIDILKEYRFLNGQSVDTFGIVQGLFDFAVERNCTIEEAMRVVFDFGRFAGSVETRLALSDFSGTPIDQKL